MSLNVPYLKPGTMGEKGAWYFGLGVALSEPMVRPWKELWNETRPVLRSPPSCLPTLRENFSAASLASEPELQMKTREAVAKAECSCVLVTRSLESSPVQRLW
jgi:hypothetical protein